MLDLKVIKEAKTIECTPQMVIQSIKENGISVKVCDNYEWFKSEFIDEVTDDSDGLELTDFEKEIIKNRDNDVELHKLYKKWIVEERDGDVYDSGGSCIHDTFCINIYDSKYNAFLGYIMLYFGLNTDVDSLKFTFDCELEELGYVAYRIYNAENKLKRCALNKINAKKTEGLVCIIDNITIKDEYQRLGVGTAVLSSIQQILSTVSAGRVGRLPKTKTEINYTLADRILGYYLLAHPFYDDSLSEKESRYKIADLTNFCEKIGFERLGGKANIFYLSPAIGMEDSEFKEIGY